MNQPNGFPWRKIGAGLRTVGTIASALGGMLSKNDTNGPSLLFKNGANSTASVSLGALQINVVGTQALLDNPTENDWVVTFSSVNSQGAPILSEILVKKKSSGIDVTGYLAQNFTGLANYSIVPENTSTNSMELSYCIKNWGCNTISAFDHKFTMVADMPDNQFVITTNDYNFSNVSIQAVNQRGDVYNFSVGDIPKSQSLTKVPYPEELDQALPISRLTLWITGDISYLK